MIGPNHELKILDFGIGCLLAETEGESLVDTMSTANSVASGLDCASPESIMDPTNLTPAGDQYSLGCILYYMLTGQYPFPDGSAAEKMMAHQFKTPTPIHELSPDVPADLVAIVERLMKKTPQERFASTSEIVQELKHLSTAPTTDSPRSQARPLPGRDNFVTSKPAPQAAPEGLKSLSGSAVAPPKSPVDVSTATPRPQAIGTLPTRNSLKGVVAPPPPPPAPAEVLDENGERVVPGGCKDVPVPISWEERLGPTGITVAAVAACAVVYIVAAFFHLF